MKRTYDAAAFVPYWDKVWAAYKAGHLTLLEARNQGIVAFRASFLPEDG